MRVQCDVCGVSPAAVLCCADEAALCSACDRRVHRANRLAGKHRRLPLIHPSSSGEGGGDGDATASPPMCDVCREKRGLVFCVEDRAILCADCDEPIHAANDLTAKHTRFLLVGTKLSAAAPIADDEEHAIPSSDCSSDDAADDGIAATKEDHSSAVSAAVDAAAGAGGGGGGGSSISDYLTTICPGWRVEDLLLPDDGDAFATAGVGAAVSTRKEKDDERVPFIDDDLFDVVGGGGAGWPEKKGGGAWAPHVPQLPAWCLDDVATMPAPAATTTTTTTTTTVKPAKQGHVRERQYWNDSDAFAVPEFSPSPPAKRARPSQQYWCF